MKKLLLAINQDIVLPNAYVIEYENKSYEVYFDGDIFYDQSFIEEIKLIYPFIKTNYELLFYAYQIYHHDAFRHIDGAFILIIKQANHLEVIKDILGLYPLYYTCLKQTYYISNDLNSLLALDDYLATISKDGLLQLFTLNPACCLHQTLFDKIYQVPMFHKLEIINHVLEISQYYHLKSIKHVDDFETTCAKVKQLVSKSILRQGKDINACFLSGGLDSSIICKVLSNHKPIHTYSLDYEDNLKYFKENKWQTSHDAYFIKQMVNDNRMNHHNYTITNQKLINLLNQSNLLRSLPGMGDIDASLYWLCKQISCYHDGILSGECADEFFGGYPWFYREELQANPLPWISNFEKRLALINEKYRDLPFLDYLKQQEYLISKQVEVLDSDCEDDIRARKHTLLVINYFMQCLVTRQNTMSDKLNIRAPFASIELLEYVYNIPWEYKFYQQQEKGLLREAFKDLLPKEIYERKKNPFPKTHHPKYNELISDLLKQRLDDPHCILYELFDKNSLQALINHETSFDTPWYGQLMSGPQLLAYLYQIDNWFNHYHLKIIENN